MNQGTARNRLPLPSLLIAIGLVIATLFGGHVPLDGMGISGGIFEGLFNEAAPLLTHGLILTPFVAALLTLVLQRRITQVPNTTLAGVLVIFFGLVMASVPLSSFRFASLGVALEWLGYGVVFFTSVAAGGRRSGPRIFTSALFIGTVLLALRGIVEYGAYKAIDPTWRIFGGWNNPNALAAMLLVGFFLGLGLMLVEEERIVSLLSGIGSVTIGLAILLTQSKGALLVLAVVLIPFCLAAIAFTGKESKLSSFLRLGVVLLAVGMMFFLLRMQASTPLPTGQSGSSSAASRVTDLSSTSEQSAGFRQLLWKGAAQMVRENPLGYGIGSYRFESGRSGLHTQTVYAHNAFLQLAAEGSPLLPLLLFAAGILWLRLLFRGFKELPPERRIRTLSTLAAVIAIVGHSLFDSDLYYFGVGTAFFTLLGSGLLLSSDAVAPEFSPKAFRRLAAGGAIAVLLGLFYVGYAEALRAQARWAIASSDFEKAASALASARTLAPVDGEAWYMSALASKSGTERMIAANRAVDLAPSTRNTRLLARLYADSGQNAQAETAFRQALERDPNNLATLNQLADLYGRMGQTEAQRVTLQKLVRIEESSYFKIRSLPDLVPTETYAARVALASFSGVSEDDQIALLEPAVMGFDNYRARTLPQVLQMAKQTPPGDYGGENPQRAGQKMIAGASAARRLAELQRTTGRFEEAARSEEVAGKFDAAASELGTAGLSSPR